MTLCDHAYLAFAGAVLDEEHRPESEEAARAACAAAGIAAAEFLGCRVSVRLASGATGVAHASAPWRGLVPAAFAAAYQEAADIEAFRAGDPAAARRLAARYQACADRRTGDFARAAQRARYLEWEACGRPAAWDDATELAALGGA